MKKIVVTLFITFGYFTPVLLLINILFMATADSFLYYGESDITPEQYTQISVDNYLAGLDNTIFENEEGELKFKYDFYSDEEYEYLESQPLTFWNTPFIHEFFTMDSWATVVIILFIPIIIVFGIWISKNQRRFDDWSKKVNLRFEKVQDAKVPEIQNGNILNNANQLSLLNIKGILCARSWKVNKQYNLKSIVQDTIWETKELSADKLPKKESMDGVYGYRLGASIHQKDKVMGIVELDGKYEYHTDIIRAEHCKIHGLFMSKGRSRLARQVSFKYGLPIYLSDDSETAYLEWLFSQNGQDSLQHNFELMKEA